MAGWPTHQEDLTVGCETVTGAVPAILAPIEHLELHVALGDGGHGMGKCLVRKEPDELAILQAIVAMIHQAQCVLEFRSPCHIPGAQVEPVVAVCDEKRYGLRCGCHQLLDVVPVIVEITLDDNVPVNKKQFSLILVTALRLPA